MLATVAQAQVVQGAGQVQTNMKVIQSNYSILLVIPIVISLGGCFAEGSVVAQAKPTAKKPLPDPATIRLGQQEKVGDQAVRAGDLSKSIAIYESLAKSSNPYVAIVSMRKLATCYELSGDNVNARESLRKVLNSTGNSIASDPRNALKLVYFGLLTGDRTAQTFGYNRFKAIDALEHHRNFVNKMAPTEQEIVDSAMTVAVTDPVLAVSIVTRTGGMALISDEKKFSLALGLSVIGSDERIGIYKSLASSSNPESRRRASDKLARIKDIKETKIAWVNKTGGKPSVAAPKIDFGGFETNGYWPTGQKLTPTSSQNRP